MKKEEIKRYRKEINHVKRMLGIASKRLDEGRYAAALELISGEAAMLQGLVSQLNEFIEEKGGV